MAHLTDMEELVSSIQSTDSRNYMREAMACYMAGAYRASVVLTFIAMFDDIMRKLNELGKVNSKAKLIHDAAAKKRGDQEVFETYLIDQLKSNSLITALDSGFFEILRILRNKAAHPSGHAASAEEARFVFSEATKRFLAKPILSTTQLADEVLELFENENLFPSTSITVITEIVSKELSNLHEETYPYLIAKLVGKMISENSEVVKNARFFLSGMAKVADEKLLAALRKFGIEKNASNSKYDNMIINLLSGNGKLFSDLDSVTYQRLAILIEKNVVDIELTVEHNKFHHPATLFSSLISSGQTQNMLAKLNVQFDKFLDRFTFSAYFATHAKQDPVVVDLLVQKYLKFARSTDFQTVNTFVQHLKELDKLMSDALSDSMAFEIVVNVVRAAEMGAYGAIDMRNSHFSAVEKLREKSKVYLINNDIAAKALAIKILKVEEAELDELLKSLEPIGP